MFGGFDTIKQFLTPFNPLATDDPAKMAYRSATLQLLAGAQPGQVMQNMPSTMLAMKQQQRKHELDKRRLAIDEAQLADTEQRTRLAKAQEAREAEKQRQQEVFGQAFGRYNLDPLSEVSEPHADGTVSVGKTDRAAPTGEEGNPYAQQIMNLPLTLRRAMSDAPLAASEEVQAGLQKGMEGVFDDDPTRIDSEVITLISPDGKQTRSFDMKDQRQNMEGRSALAQGWNKINPAQTVKQIGETGWRKGETDQIGEINTQTDAASGTLENMETIGSLLLHDDVYTGTGGDLLANVVKAGQNTLGIWKDIDTSRPQAAQKASIELVSKLRKEFFAQDKNWSNADSKYVQAMGLDITNDRAGIARIIAMQRSKVAMMNEKRDYLQNAMENGGLTLNQAKREWDAKYSRAAAQKYFSEKVIGGHMTELTSKSRQKSALEYIGGLVGDVEEHGIPDAGMAPEGSAPPGGRPGGKWEQGADGVWEFR